MTSISSHYSFKILIEILMCFFFMYGFLADMAKKIYRACKKVWSFSNPRKRWRQDTKNLKLLFCFPLLLPTATFCCNNEELAVILVGIDCLRASSDTFDHYEKQLTEMRKGDGIQLLLDAFSLFPNLWMTVKWVERMKRLQKKKKKKSL